ncbi:hypothetical protein KKF91_18055 [Myxococcota bacterium]|nr:hypothetical protein [Myxococcota bacterium]MBU1432446.1 hypothetical protein [Myxococcota bacterium]MBU1899981.1 hypothetical protein [Myxococcota bacterium]
MSAPRSSAILLFFASLSVACEAAQEAPRVQLEVVVDARPLAPEINALGYEITLDGARLASRGLVFTVAGEASQSGALAASAASPWRYALDLLGLRRAHAHPGHYQGGEVTGALEGAFAADWFAPTSLGQATLLGGVYTAANFTLARGDAAQGLSSADPLWGHAMWLRGVARRDGQAYPFEARIDAPEDREVVGIPFKVEITPQTVGQLSLRFHLRDPYEGKTPFDGVDFAALPLTDVIQIQAGDEDVEDAYNFIRREVMQHDYFSVELIKD